MNRSPREKVMKALTRNRIMAYDKLFAASGMDSKEGFDCLLRGLRRANLVTCGGEGLRLHHRLDARAMIKKLRQMPTSDAAVATGTHAVAAQAMPPTIKRRGGKQAQANVQAATRRDMLRSCELQLAWERDTVAVLADALKDAAALHPEDDELQDLVQRALVGVGERIPREGA
jgi:hypothetical protein